MNVAVSFSGGKDSCLALYKASMHGHTISYLVNTISDDYKRVRFHGLKDSFIQKQAEALGVPLKQQASSSANYEADYLENLKEISGGIDGIVFGDIHLEECLDWAKKIAKNTNLQLIEPLWHIPQEKILNEFIESGFEAIVVSTQANLLDETWVGRKIDQQFIKDLKRVGNIDLCGENGEFHTATLDGPIFKKRIEIIKSKKVFISNFWFLDIEEFKLVNKISK